MLGYRRLRDLHPRNDIAYRPLLAIVEKIDDLSPPRLRDCIEDVGGRRDSCHTAQYIPISPYMSRTPVLSNTSIGRPSGFALVFSLIGGTAATRMTLATRFDPIASYRQAGSIADLP